MNTQSFLSITMAVIAIAGGMVATLMLSTLIMAGAANGKPRELLILKASLIATLAIGGLCLIGAIIAIWKGQEWLAVLIGAAPVATCAVCLGLLFWLLRPV